MSSTTSRYFSAPAYMLAFLLAFIPMLDLLVTAWPIRLDNVRWRLAAAGQFGTGATTILLGLLVAYTVAWLRGHTRVQWLVGIVSGILGLVLMMVLGLVALDAVQLRGDVRPELARAFDLVTTQSLVKLLFAMIVATVMSVGTLRRAKADAAAGPRPRTDPTLLIVGAPDAENPRP